MDDFNSDRPAGSRLGGYPPPAGAVTFNGLWRETVDVAARNRTLLATVAGGLVVFDILLNLLAGERTANSLGNIVSFIAIYLLMREILRQERLIENEGGFWPYFVASLLAGLGAAVGLVLLIVPGLYLLARWAIAPALTIARRLPGVDAMKESWRLTGDAAWTLVGFYVVIGLAVLVIAFVAGAIGGVLDGGAGTVTLVLTSIVSDTFVALSAALSIAIYRQLAGTVGTMRDVFE